MQILKQINDQSNIRERAEGFLFGLDSTEHKLEVTQAIPIPSLGALDGEDMSATDFQIEYQTLLRDVNADIYSVGWYTTSTAGVMLSQHLVDTFEALQNQFDAPEHAITLVFDQHKMQVGELSLRAFRFSTDYLFYADGASNDFIDPLTILQEVPVHVVNSSLVSAMLASFSVHQPTIFSEGLSARLEMNYETIISAQAKRITEMAEGLREENYRLINDCKKHEVERKNMNNWLWRRKIENREREKNGEPKLSEDPRDGGFSIDNPPERVQSVVASSSVLELANELQTLIEVADRKLKAVRGREGF
jgi:hypothetical protein